MDKEKYNQEKKIKRSQILSAIRKGRSSEVVTRLLLAFEEFTEKFSKSKPKVNKADAEKIKTLEGRVAELEYYISTVNGLWAIDKNPKDVTKKFIVDNAFQINIKL